MPRIAANRFRHRYVFFMGVIGLVLSGCERTTGDPADGSIPPQGDAKSTDVSSDGAGRLDVESLDASGADTLDEDSCGTSVPCGVPDAGISPDGPSDAQSSDTQSVDMSTDPCPCSIPDGGISTDGPSDTQSVDMAVDVPASDSRVRDVPTERGLECTPDTGDRLCCTQDQPVWDSSSTSFGYGRSYNDVSPPPIAGACNNARLIVTSERYEFSVTDQTLLVHRCASGGSSIRLVHLAPARVDAIVAAVSLVRTTCVLECVSGIEYMELAVPASGLGPTYVSNVRAACANPRPVPPFVAYDGLRALDKLLGEIVTNACSAAVDAEADAGWCENSDGGIRDASAGG
jgi:hypothetical protein